MRRIILFFVLSTACIGCDQGTKVIATRTLRGRAPMSFLADTIRLQYAENEGAFLGMGSRLPESWRLGLFTVMSAVLVLGTIVYMFRRRDLTLAQFAALTLLAAGGIGNLIDRVFGGGAVVDFLNVGVGRWLRTGIFNVADVAIMAGALALLALQSASKLQRYRVFQRFIR